MVAFVFGDFAHSIHEIQGLLEIGKAELAMNVVLVRDRPLRNTLVQLCELFSAKRWRAAAAGHTFLVG